MDVVFLEALLKALFEALKAIFAVINVAVTNPITAIISGIIIAFVPRYVFWGIGLALIVYGALTLLMQYFPIAH
ncbi:MAG: hypothetical protein ABWK05_07130 [Pyrobaculum sp.]